MSQRLASLARDVGHSAKPKDRTEEYRRRNAKRKPDTTSRQGRKQNRQAELRRLEGHSAGNDGQEHAGKQVPKVQAELRLVKKLGEVQKAQGDAVKQARRAELTQLQEYAVQHKDFGNAAELEAELRQLETHQVFQKDPADAAKHARIAELTRMQEEAVRRKDFGKAAELQVELGLFEKHKGIQKAKPDAVKQARIAELTQLQEAAVQRKDCG